MLLVMSQNNVNCKQSTKSPTIMGSEQTVSLFVSNAHILYTRFELNSFNYKIRHKNCFESNTIEEKNEHFI